MINPFDFENLRKHLSDTDKFSKEDFDKLIYFFKVKLKKFFFTPINVEYVNTFQ